MRPWKARFVATIFWRPVAERANFIAASLASVPELQSQTFEMSPGGRRELVVQLRAFGVRVRRLHVGQLRGLLADGAVDRRVLVAQRDTA